MKRTSYLFLLLPLLFLGACKQQEPDNVCHIHGTLPDDSYEGKRMFLIQLQRGQGNDGVDSTEVHNRQFEFTTTRNEMATLRMDYHFRYGLQELLVVEEPGDVMCFIGANSSASGTPQNDSLAMWKQKIEMYHANVASLRKKSQGARAEGDTVKANHFKAKADSLYQEFRSYTRRMVDNLKEGPLHDFLDRHYPVK